jgi:hypothetical protein
MASPPIRLDAKQWRHYVRTAKGCTPRAAPSRCESAAGTIRAIGHRWHPVFTPPRRLGPALGHRRLRRQREGATQCEIPVVLGGVGKPSQPAHLNRLFLCSRDAVSAEPGWPLRLLLCLACGTSTAALPADAGLAIPSHQVAVMATPPPDSDLPHVPDDWPTGHIGSSSISAGGGGTIQAAAQLSGEGHLTAGSSIAPVASLSGSGTLTAG